MSSTSNLSGEFGGITGGKPREPYAYKPVSKGRDSHEQDRVLNTYIVGGSGENGLLTQ